MLRIKNGKLVRGFELPKLTEEPTIDIKTTIDGKGVIKIPEQKSGKTTAEEVYRDGLVDKIKNIKVDMEGTGIANLKKKKFISIKF
jgi:hypothetical protein